MVHVTMHDGNAAKIDLWYFFCSTFQMKFDGFSCCDVPDLYDIGTSHFGIQILYHLFNQHDGWAAERVFAPAKDWINRSDQDIVDATMEELKKLFPTHFMGDDKTNLRKYKVVKTLYQR